MATCSIQRLWGAKNPSFFHIWPVCSKMSFHTTDCEKYPNSMRDSVQRRIHWVVLVIFSFWSGILIWRWWCASHGAEEAKFRLRGQADAFSFFCCLVPILKNFFFRSDFLALVGTMYSWHSHFLPHSEVWDSRAFSTFVPLLCLSQMMQMRREATALKWLNWTLWAIIFKVVFRRQFDASKGCESSLLFVSL